MILLKSIALEFTVKYQNGQSKYELRFATDGSKETFESKHFLVLY
jgi:hypothetical protein